MGGCATKPKVLKGDEIPSPVAPPPEPAKHVQVAADEGKKVEAEIVKAKDVDETKEVVIVNNEKVDDQANDPQSVSKLLNENERKGVAETESDSNTPSEPTKTESVEAVKQESMETDPSSVGGKAATVAVGETQNRETAAAGEEGKTEVTK
ncbi:uncharacterized protein LOC105763647 [Gossypium raimondii]|uniref:Uncharacterized protein n=1 Tax=Gossypium raimondii TaxID=29730 RepID=A0A0D2Q4L3_GOSRA|nr:uncharacterized protein LOC105763647 [Gossypium raimondii]KJB53277.1 hypothetical protein B456_008G099900 [Gossypium raimondii]MBA0592265.1 hypothetical protein [Gossypium raimondii]